VGENGSGGGVPVDHAADQSGTKTVRSHAPDRWFISV
jgi:hypothetical protein